MTLLLHSITHYYKIYFFYLTGPSVVWNAWKDVHQNPMFDICPDGLMKTAEGRTAADACVNQLWCNECSAGWKDFLIPGIIGWSECLKNVVVLCV